jgi:hypothetical protein
MNEKIQAILLKMSIELKKLQWKPAPDWELTLKGEGHVPLIKSISVKGIWNDKEWRDKVEVYIDLRIVSDDEITYFPTFTIYGTIAIEGAPSKDIAIKLDSDVAFTDKDTRNEKEIGIAARKIDRMVENHIEAEYGDYIDKNLNKIKAYKQGNPSNEDGE